MKSFLTLSLLLLLAGEASAFRLKSGDLIFQESYNGSLGSAIKDVTSSIEEYQFTHVGIVYIDNDEAYFVLEATRPYVKLTPLSEYLYPNKEAGHYPKSVVARLKQEYQHIIPSALDEGMALLGKPYNEAFDLESDAYYCSELIFHILRKANDDKDVFPLNEMTFKSADTGEYSNGWITHFERLGIPIPEGKPGINPGAMSQTEVVDIVHIWEQTDNSRTIHGKLTDASGRCEHYHSHLDVIANKCYTCKKYYACHQCHNETENHKLEPWRVTENSQEKLILCGNCSYEMTYSEYKCSPQCPSCHHPFNPGCALHSHLYFQVESEDSER